MVKPGTILLRPPPIAGFLRTPRVRLPSRLDPAPSALRRQSNIASPDDSPSANQERSQSSVSPTELSHFTSLASSWWDPHGSSRLLHLMNPLRHQFISSCLATQMPSDPSRSYSYLDVGCGGGIFAESAARLQNSSRVVGIDPGEEVIAVAKGHQRRDPALVNGGRLEYKQTAIEDLSIPASPADGYDIVTLFEVLEHVSSPSKFLQNLSQHLKPGGWLILSTIARTWTSWFTTKVMAEDVLRILPRGTHDWTKYIEESELRSWFKNDTTQWERPRAMGVVYVPGLGWREISGSETFGNYFFGVRKSEV